MRWPRCACSTSTPGWVGRRTETARYDGIFVMAPDDHVFPTLTDKQISRIAAHGRRRAVAAGETLVEIGAADIPFFVLVRGEIQVVRSTRGTQSVIVTHAPGQFTGEANMFSGRRALANVRSTADG